MMTELPRWFTSSYSGNGGQCLQVAVNLAATHGVVPVRDSKSPSESTLLFRTGAFDRFVGGVKSGFGSR
ncbi:DUF397 domain-containing protein [Streptomyces griseoviridis]